MNPQDIIGHVSDLLLASTKGKKIFEQVREGSISEEEASWAFIQVAQEEGFLGDIAKSAGDMSDLALTHLKAQAGDEPPLMTETSTGVSQLNPVLEGYLAERASLDGDIPELRTGLLPDDVDPAPPVETSLLDPVAVGWMLERASGEVKEKLTGVITQHALECEKLLSDAAVGTDLQVVRDSLPPVPTGVPGYMAGEIPALMRVAQPNPLAIANLSSEAARKLSWKTLSTTQGRKSLSSPIELHLIKRLADAGHQVSSGRTSSDPIRQSTWGTNAYGADDLSEDFNFGLVAVSAFEREFLPFLEGSKRYRVQVKPLGRISDRHFGWAATLFEEVE